MRFLSLTVLSTFVAWSAGLNAAPDAGQPPPDAGPVVPIVAQHPPEPTTEATLRAALEQRLVGDRTGACLAAAVIDRGVSRAFVCADPSRTRAIDSKTAFEIGSVTKTMTAFLLADLVAQKKLSLDDPLAQHLPPGTKTPTFGNKPIRLKHLVTHTSGLPALPGRMVAARPDNPYATLTEDALLASLGDVTLEAAPGTHWAYSNFAVMVLSDVVSRVARTDIESLLNHRLFRPLGMRQAYIARKPPGVRTAEGHLPTGGVTSAWDIPVNLAGVGGVRASLDDMVRYAQAELGRVDGSGAQKKAMARITALMAETQQPVDLGEPTAPVGPRMGMGWVLTSKNRGRPLVLHEGGTGGFSAYVAIERGSGIDGGRAVVILSDTALHSLGGIGDIGLHLLDPNHPLGQPRKTAQASPELVQSLIGRYRLAGAPDLTLSERKGTLFVQATGQQEFELAFDSQGDFYPLAFDALLTPIRAVGGGRTFTWTQGGGRLSATRVSP